VKIVAYKNTGWKAANQSKDRMVRTGRRRKRKGRRRRIPCLKALNYPPLRDLITAIDKII
jgi:hypothetical protein